MFLLNLKVDQDADEGAFMLRRCFVASILHQVQFFEKITQMAIEDDEVVEWFSPVPIKPCFDQMECLSRGVGLVTGKAESLELGHQSHV